MNALQANATERSFCAAFFSLLDEDDCVHILKYYKVSKMIKTTMRKGSVLCKIKVKLTVNI